MRRLALLLILLFSLLFRTLWIGSFPVGFTPDEASFGYDAYSLLKTGKDQWGDSWPISFRSFGDFKLPVYTYLAVPSVAIFGLNEFAVRLPNALIGVLAVLATYLFVKGVFKDEYLALFASLLLAISSWHVSLSRGAFEANLTSLFIPIALWTYYKGLKKPKWMVISALVFGINLFTYHSARLVTPLLVLFLVFWTRKGRNFRKYLTPIAIFSLFLLLAAFTVFTGSGARASDITIFSPTDKWVSVFDRRYEAIFEGLPNSVARFFNNKPLSVADKFISAYATYLSPQFLFTQGASEWTYGMIPGRGVLYLIEALFVLLSLWFLAKSGFKKSRSLLFFLIWILIAPLPAALTKGPGYAGNRAATMMPAIQIFSAFGGVLLFKKLKNYFPNKLILLSYSLVFLISLIFFLEDYHYHAPRGGAPGMLYGRREAVEFTSSIQDKYSEIIFSRSLSEPQIFVAFYTKWDPLDYQNQSQDWLRYKEQDLPFVDQLGEYHLGKYTFRNINYNEAKKIPNILLVGKPREFPQEVTPLETVFYPNGAPAIFIVDPNLQSYAKAQDMSYAKAN